MKVKSSALWSGTRRLAGTVVLSLGFSVACGQVARLSLSPLSGPNNAEEESVVVLQNPGRVVAIQFDLERVADRLEIISFTLGAASAGLQLRTSTLANGQTRLVLFSNRNTPLSEGEIIKVKGIRRNLTSSLEHALSLRAVTIADDRGLLREFAFVPYVGLTMSTTQPIPGQPVVFEGLIFPTDAASGGLEVRVNGRLVSQTGGNRFSVTWTPLEPGLAFITAMTQGGGAAAVPLTVPVAGGTLDSYAKWRSFHFPGDPVSSTGPGQPLGDADADTAVNLWEYFRGSGPNAPGDGNPAVEEVMVKSGPDEFLGLKVRVRNVATDFEVVGEASGTMAFTPALTSNALVVTREAAGEFSIVTLRDTVSVRESDRRFIRARIRPVTP